jgi:hypothetical protein|nr:MAG TPA: Ead/Ea22-like protein [Caudoviricetes sp.]
MTIERFDCGTHYDGGVMLDSDDGEYVYHKDYAALEAKCAALAAELEAAEKRIDILRQDKDKVIDMSTERVSKLLARAEDAEKRVAELKARELVVNLPAYVDGRTLGYGEVNHMIDLCADAIEKAGHAAGIITKVGE